MTTLAQYVEEDAVVPDAAAEGSLGVLEVHDVARQRIDAHAGDGGVDAGKVAIGQPIELLLRAFGEADAPGVRRARLGTAHKGPFHPLLPRLGRV